MEISSKSLRRFLEVSANLGIIIVAVILIGNFVSSKWRPKRDSEKLAAGSKISLSGASRFFILQNLVKVRAALTKSPRHCSNIKYP
jgi:hypothetical protein